MEKVIDDVYSYLSSRSIIQDDFWSRSEKNPSFSLRSYSSKVGVSPSFLSKYLNQKNNISDDKLDSILKNIGLGQEESDYVTLLNRYEQNKAKGLSDIALEESIKEKYNMPKTTQFGADHALVNSPYHFLLSAIVGGKDKAKKSDLFETFKMIKNDHDFFESVLEDLVKGNVLAKTDEGTFLKVNVNSIITDSDQRVIDNNLELSKIIHSQIQKNGDFDDRNISNGLSLVIKKENIKQVKEITKKCLHDLMRLSSDEKDSEKIEIVLYTQEFVILDN